MLAQAKRNYWRLYGRDVTVIIFIFIFGGLIFCNAWPHTFQYDDIHFVEKNPHLKQLDPRGLWEFDPARFIPNLTLVINYLTFGLKPEGWYFTNFFLHLINAFLIYRLTLVFIELAFVSSSMPSAWKLANISSLIFLIHPYQLNVVNHLSQRAVLVGSMFCLLTLYLYFLDKKITRRVERSSIFLWLAVGILFLNILSHPYVVFLPLIIMLLELFFISGDKPTRKRIMFGTVICFLSLALIAVWLIIHPKITWTAAWEYRRYLQHTKGFVFFPVQVFDLSGFIQERGFYLGSSVLILILLGVLVKVFNRQLRILSVMGFVIIGVLALSSIQESFLLANPLTALDHDRKYGQDPVWYHFELGNFYLKANKWAQARREFDLALSMPEKSIYFPALNQKAFAFYNENNLAAAKEIWEELLNKYPLFPESYLGIAMVYQKLNRPQEAAYFFRETIKREPDLAAAHFALGYLFQTQNDFADAERAYRTALRLDPDNGLGHYNLGNLFFKAGKFYDALDQYNQAIAVWPDFFEAYHNRGNIFFYFRDYPKAIEQYRLAIKVNGLNPDVFYNLANALYEQGRFDESRRAIMTAVQLYEKQGRHDIVQRIRPKLPSVIR